MGIVSGTPAVGGPQPEVPSSGWRRSTPVMMDHVFASKRCSMRQRPCRRPSVKRVRVTQRT